MPLERFDDVVAHVDRLCLAEGPDKVTSLKDAVARHVRPGMAIHTGISHVFPYALCNEITRQFHGTRPGFTVYSLGATNHVVIWVLEGFVKRIVTSYCGDVYPAPGPNPAFNEAYVSGDVAFENWTVLSYSLRMLAGAMGWPFVPTRSLVGSTMETDNAAFLRVVDEPGAGKIALLAPALPDVSIYHAWAADRFGNAIFTPPYSENLWGAMAARDGAVITCERIVDTSFIRRHAALARLPGQYVKAVVHAPMGAHPGGYYSAAIEGLEGYAEDYDFIVEFRRSNRKPDTFAQWLNDWVLGVADHAGYLARLGEPHLRELKRRSNPEYWREEFARFESGLDDGQAWNPAEYLTVAAAREIRRRVDDAGYKTILAGQGNANLAAWMAYYALKDSGIPCDLVAETGFFGYTPRPSNPFLFNFSNIPTCTTLTDAMQTLGVFVGGTRAACIGSLSAGQVDRSGNINSTCVPGAYYLVGSGGANDVASTARELVIAVPLSPMRYIEQVPYVTAPGRAVTAVVSDECILRRRGDALVLAAILDTAGDGLKSPSAREARVRAVREKCGWALSVADDVGVEPAPSLFELKVLRAFDPRRAFIR